MKNRNRSNSNYYLLDKFKNTGEEISVSNESIDIL